MNKEEIITRYGKAAYKKKLQQGRDWNVQHREEHSIHTKKWQGANPDKVEAIHREVNHKGGKYYEHALEHKRTGIPGERSRIRAKHGRIYRVFKQLIAPLSQIHHEWIPGTTDFRGVALVETDQHMHGFIDVIQILEGGITLLTEKEIKG